MRAKLMGLFLLVLIRVLTGAQARWQGCPPKAEQSRFPAAKKLREALSKREPIMPKQRKSLKLLRAQQRVDEVGKQQRSAETAKSIQNSKVNHDLPPADFSSLCKPLTNSATTPYSAAMPTKNTISI